MKINYEDEIKNISSLLEGKYKERQDILDNFENKNMSYFEILDKEIEEMEEEMKRLNLNNKINNINESKIHDNNKENIIYNLEISDNEKIIIKQKLKIENKHSEFNNYYINLIMDLNRLLLNIKLFEKNYEDIKDFKKINI